MKRFNSMLAGRLATMFQGTLPAGLEREEGQTLVEYALILALIAVVVAGALIILQTQITGLFSTVGNNL